MTRTRGPRSRFSWPTHNKPMNAGLGQGFVRFGTLAHIILKLMAEAGPQSNNSICAHLDDLENLGQTVHDKRAVAANLGRLLKYGFIVEVGRVRPDSGRSAAVFHYNPFRPKEFQLKKMTPAERQKKHRMMRGKRVNNVFDFRGTIKL